MGHIRLGRLPKKGPWKKVFDAFTEHAADPAAISQAVAGASASRFELLRSDPTLNFYVWTLVRVLAASRTSDFSGELNKLGFKIGADATSAEFLSKLSRFAAEEARQRGEQSIFTSIAHKSFQSVITTAIVKQSDTLFGSGLADVQEACKRASTDDRFGAVARQFFTNLLSSTVRFVADKEVANHVGYGRTLDSIDGISEFHQGIDRYCKDMGQLVENFAAQWYSKQNRIADYKISEKATKRFTAYAFTKLQSELAGVAK